MRNMRWGWILIGGLLGEFVAIVFLEGLRLLHGSRAPSAQRLLRPLSARA